MNQIYLDTARLLTQVAPLVFTDNTFALKGGTAINLFVRDDMPRLSVDLDLVFPDYTLPRAQALAQINDAIRQAAERLMARGFQVHMLAATETGETKLLVRRGNVEVKIEVNFVMRGTIHPVGTASLTQKAREVLRADLEAPLVSLEDMYGGKLVAAMDRQHPRDLFDVVQLFEHEGITPAIRQAFVVYLASHNRPVHEVLFPAKRDIVQEYERTFRGMTTDPVALEDLLKARDRMMTELHQGLDAGERTFLVSLARNEPD
jgi:predicted nucleotidyltransferase component of viral defense system